MDPKSAKQTPEQILQHINSTVEKLNMHALAHYVLLLRKLGVGQCRVYREFFLP